MNNLNLCITQYVRVTGKYYPATLFLLEEYKIILKRDLDSQNFGNILNFQSILDSEDQK